MEQAFTVYMCTKHTVAITEAGSLQSDKATTSSVIGTIVVLFLLGYFF